MGQEFLTYSLMIWVKRWESEIRLKLFSPEERAIYIAEFLTDDFARADQAARMILTPTNHIRSRCGSFTDRHRKRRRHLG
jgi:hypothetical protein